MATSAMQGQATALDLVALTATIAATGTNLWEVRYYQNPANRSVYTIVATDKNPNGWVVTRTSAGILSAVPPITCTPSINATTMNYSIHTAIGYFTAGT